MNLRMKYSYWKLNRRYNGHYPLIRRIKEKFEDWKYWRWYKKNDYNIGDYE